MPVLEVGSRRIPYTVRRSDRVRARRIIVTPELVEVVAPAGQSDEEIATFVHARRRWVHDQTERMQERISADRAAPSRFVSGAKVLYRGRRLRLVVRPAEVQEVELEFRGSFTVRVPQTLTSGSQQGAVEQALTSWLRDRAREDTELFVRRYASKLGVAPAGIRMKEQKHLWGSCGRDGTININWHLIFAPRSVLEYAVAHELCHLRVRTHGPEFWQLLQGVLPDFKSRKTWLEQNELHCRWR